MKNIALTRRLLQFLIAMAVIGATSFSFSDGHVLNNYIVQDDGVAWSVKLDPDKPNNVLITVKTINMQEKTYLSKVKCKVLFYDAKNKPIGPGDFVFTDKSLTSLEPGRTYKRQFPSPFALTKVVKGDYMSYEIAVLGAKSDNPRDAPPPPRQGMVKATEEGKSRPRGGLARPQRVQP